MSKKSRDDQYREVMRKHNEKTRSERERKKPRGARQGRAADPRRAEEEGEVMIRTALWVLVAVLAVLVAVAAVAAIFYMLLVAWVLP